MKLLSYGRHPKGSTSLCLFETDFVTFTNDFFNWWHELGRNFSYRNIDGKAWLDFFEAYDNLKPRYVITPTRSNWVVFFNNSAIGDIHWSVFRNMAERLKIRSLGISVDELEVAQNLNRPFAIQFWYADGRKDSIQDRAISLIYDIGKWSFEQYGPALPFEEIEIYTQKTKRNRLSVKMIEHYLGSLGIEYDNDSFLMTDKAIGIVEHFENLSEKQSFEEIKRTIERLNQALPDELKPKGAWTVVDGKNNKEYRF